MKILKESQVIGLILRKNDKNANIRNMMITMKTDNFIVDTLRLRTTILEKVFSSKFIFSTIISFNKTNISSIIDKFNRAIIDEQTPEKYIAKP